MLLLRIAIMVLCATGLYVSLHMLRKSGQAERGVLEAPSVVTEPDARLLFGVPNALFGSVYYPLLAAAVWTPILFWLAVAAAVAAAATSLVLAYRLLFVLKRECAYCWTAHAVNWLLALLVPLLA